MQGLQEYLGVVDVTGVDVAVPGLANDAGMAVGMRLMALRQWVLAGFDGILWIFCGILWGFVAELSGFWRSLLESGWIIISYPVNKVPNVCMGSWLDLVDFANGSWYGWTLPNNFSLIWIVQDLIVDFVMYSFCWGFRCAFLGGSNWVRDSISMTGELALRAWGPSYTNSLFG